LFIRIFLRVSLIEVIYNPVKSEQINF
jgi:hypothetical protein